MQPRHQLHLWDVASHLLWTPNHSSAHPCALQHGRDDFEYFILRLRTIISPYVDHPLLALPGWLWLVSSCQVDNWVISSSLHQFIILTVLVCSDQEGLLLRQSSGKPRHTGCQATLLDLGMDHHQEEQDGDDHLLFEHNEEDEEQYGGLVTSVLCIHISRPKWHHPSI